MIKNTFSVFDGIGEGTEKKLWKKGIMTWEDFVNEETIPFVSRERKCDINKSVESYTKGLEDGNWSLFARCIKRKEHWRFFELFKNDAVCLDIETNGLPRDCGGYITVVGLYDGTEYTSLVSGKGLTETNLIKALSPYKYLITFYGAVFDIPFLLTSYPTLNLEMLHYDVCLDSRRIGMRGGLKKYEKCFGINRVDEVDGMNGFDAVRLWHMYKRGDKASLETLIKYNREDTVNLLVVAQYVYNELKRATGIGDYLKL
ncbi:MAG: ribonuclease H-like domain-containing protein [Magnetococcales bacterium]|uniref:Ribonuclease H-like domain-containing protein n=1 Tax=Candidatus Magnetobacterium casense TaxID=1455061 RepID=A0ABS6RVF5_9BACT|nr:ribonuclease H-like domain-containing protein [Candidatus Magnetobacterium casensis]MBF0607497.1 ribonuclease H-like domain-containing protein [Nitrospirota bacterium]MBV6340607.1 ribonuclease H-like domain-containing protein [Candidatus Magnetobacterium casensis]